MLRMVEYVTMPAEDPKDEIRSLKYPYISCEVICCDIMAITETLACGLNGKIISRFIEFLDQPPQMDPRLYGYFEKVSV